MINEKENIKTSKFLSLVLRHRPEAIGLTLDKNGWAEVNDLLEKMNSHGFKINFSILEEVVATNNKRRFSFNEKKSKIRASQGHSIDVELQLKTKDPPAILFHGTSERSIKSILAKGLEKRNRQYVHLSEDAETAIKVGERHGKPAVLMVAAGQMRIEGYSFYLSDNNVWLIENVPARYLKLIE